MARLLVVVTILAGLCSPAAVLAGDLKPAAIQSGVEPKLAGTKNLRPQLTPEQRRFLDEQNAIHHFGDFGVDRYDAMVHAVELLKGLSFTAGVRAAIADRVRAMPLVEFSLPQKVDEFKTQMAAPAPASPRAALNRTVFFAGAAWTSINMPIGVPLPGFGRFPPTSDPLEDPYDYAHIFNSNEGMHDMIRAKSVVIQAAGQIYLFMGLDSVGVTGEIRDGLATELYNRGIPIQRDNIIVTATHTHSGPGALTKTPFWQVATVDLFDQRVFDLMTRKLADSAEAAYRRVAPAKIGYRQTDEPTLDVQRNRRDDPEKVDRELGVIRIDNANTGAPIAVIFNLAVHPICFGSDNRHFSADLSGSAERYIEKALGGDCLAIHVQGAEGDISPREKGQRGSANLGKELGDFVLASYNQITPSNMAGFAISNVLHVMPPPYINLGLLAEGLPLNWTISMSGLIEDRADFTAFRINDDFVMATVPGEPITEIGWDIKNRSRQLGFQQVWVAGLAQHHLSYFVTESEYWQGGYEAGACVFGPETGTIIAGHAVDVVDNLAP